MALNLGPKKTAVRECQREDEAMYLPPTLGEVLRGDGPAPQELVHSCVPVSALACGGCAEWSVSELHRGDEPDHGVDTKAAAWRRDAHLAPPKSGDL